MRELQLRRAQAEEMISFCEAERPNEACGILASKDGEIVKIVKMTNASASPVRYSFDPREQFLAYRALDDNGWELGGVFHSHTHTEAEPSPTDIRLASEDVPYVIVSLADEPASIRAWRIRKANWTDDSGEIEEVPVAIVG